jgi:hypothetical protein
MTVAWPGAATSGPIFAILLPTTRTDVLGPSRCDLPSNTFTFRNSVALVCVGSLCARNRAVGATKKPRSPATESASRERVDEL